MSSTRSIGSNSGESPESIESIECDTHEIPDDSTSLSNLETTKKLKQLKLDNIAQSVKKAVVSSKPATKKMRQSSSDSSPDSELNEEFESVKSRLDEIIKNMVTKSDIEDIVKCTVKETLDQLKGELKTEIISEISESIKKEIRQDMSSEISIKCEKLNDITSGKIALNSDKIDGINLDIESIRESVSKQASELRQMKREIKDCWDKARHSLNLANHNHQYSQKNNIKILGWKETRGEQLRGDFCKLVQEKADIEINPRDILAIHRVPSQKSGPKPVIAKFVNTEIKTAVIKKRKLMKPVFAMHDHITQLNAKLISALNDDPRIHSAWYFNCKVYALDVKGVRHTFEITDDIEQKLHSIR